MNWQTRELINIDNYYLSGILTVPNLNRRKQDGCYQKDYGTTEKRNKADSEVDCPKDRRKGILRKNHVV
jgi:hypothetical protein